MAKRRRRKCLHCRQLFRADPRNRRHQRYCSNPVCQGVSKAASQRRWLTKPENRSYFTGPEQVARVQAWRAAHPGYARKRPPLRSPLQDDSLTRDIDSKGQTSTLTAPALQGIWAAQPLVLVGLIAHLTGAALQEDIALAARRFQQLAHDVLSSGGARHGGQTRPASGATTPDSAAVQLGRSSAGA